MSATAFKFVSGSCVVRSWCSVCSPQPLLAAEPLAARAAPSRALSPTRRCRWSPRRQGKAGCRCWCCSRQPAAAPGRSLGRTPVGGKHAASSLTRQLWARWQACMRLLLAWPLPVFSFPSSPSPPQHSQLPWPASEQGMPLTPQTGTSGTSRRAVLPTPSNEMPALPAAPRRTVRDSVLPYRCGQGRPGPAAVCASQRDVRSGQWRPGRPACNT